MIISDLTVDYVSFDDGDMEISGIAISYKDNKGREQRRWLEKPRRLGKWIFDLKLSKAGKKYYWCSNCRLNAVNVDFDINRIRYCMFCGAEMDGSEE